MEEILSSHMNFSVQTLKEKMYIIIDDMISSGESMLDVANCIKKLAKLRRVFVAATFGLFTNGLDSFDEAHEEGLISIRF